MARRVLLADDSVTAQNMGRRILIDAGYEVITVNNGSAALKKIAEHKPDLIIVDVYMPGYGGLEVCSRIKETKETSRIPVLLTVGKLEPFKPEEAKRVRADAFIVKPFEASELLTALTKLEDKIVPGPEPYKPGRFAKALASVDALTESSDSFGDVESGWKNRLTIPPPQVKTDHPQPEPEAPKTAAQSAQALGREEDFKPAEQKGFERPLPAGLPQDIRPEEIAAIAAAAAALRAGDVSPIASELVAAAKNVEQPKPVEESKAADVAGPVAETQLTEVPANSEGVSAVEESVSGEEPKTTGVTQEQKKEEQPPTQAEAVAEVKAEEPIKDTSEPEKVAANDAEVLAALASLTPASGELSPERSQEEPVTAAVGAVAELASVGASYTGPRWIAEAVSVPIEEASRLLEEEMFKFFAASAAMEGSKPPAAVADVKEEPRSEAVAELVTPARELRNAEGVAEIPAEVVAEAAPALEAAMAAAAGASDGAEAPPSPQQASAPTIAASETSDRDQRRESELAAAWENWRHIRASIIDPETAPAIESTFVEAAPVESQEVPQAKVPEPAVEEAKIEEVKSEPAQFAEASEAKPEEMKMEPAVQAAPVEFKPELETKVEAPLPVKEAEPEAESEGSGDPEAIASIVDDMLADLKPKLMEELSKKLAKGKKKKKS